MNIPFYTTILGRVFISLNFSFLSTRTKISFRIKYYHKQYQQKHFYSILFNSSSNSLAFFWRSLPALAYLNSSFNSILV